MLASPSTLLRDFLTATGLTFEQCRLSAAVELLAAGYDVDQAAARVGFVSCNGFTRAFKQRFRSTPTDPRARADMDYLRYIGVSGGSGLDLPSDIHYAFREQTNMSFVRWRYATRMRVAETGSPRAPNPALSRRLGASTDVQYCLLALEWTLTTRLPGTRARERVATARLTLTPQRSTGRKRAAWAGCCGRKAQEICRPAHEPHQMTRSAYKLA
ncbi:MULTISPECIES: helix-turn-helix domain-containing protein [Microbacteriaceae]|uniref:helix-turn-helix domain-containing protein n=1 Tax=Microbacterium sp. JB110 TaxID=2024477 RepID=UPI001BB05E31